MKKNTYILVQDFSLFLFPLALLSKLLRIDFLYLRLSPSLNSLRSFQYLKKLGIQPLRFEDYHADCLKTKYDNLRDFSEILFQALVNRDDHTQKIKDYYSSNTEVINNLDLLVVEKIQEKISNFCDL